VVDFTGRARWRGGAGGLGPLGGGKSASFTPPAKKMGKKDLGEPEFGLRAQSTEWWRPAASPGASPRASPIRGVAQPAGQPDPGGGSARFPAWLATRLATRLATWLAARLARGLAPGRLGRAEGQPCARAAAAPEDPHTCGHGQYGGCIGERGGSRGCARCRRASTRRSGFLSLTPRRQSPHRDPPSCRAHPCIPRLPVSQCVFAAFCAARGHVPTKAQVESAFKKWGTESGFKLITTQKVAGREVWKQRPSSKLTCATAPPCTRPPPRPYQPAGRR
jgi:hypothetical protein